MGKERERKFKLKYIPKGDFNVKNIKQAYLMFDGKKHLRVRIIDDKESYITYKKKINSEERLEYEYEIPLSDAFEMFDSAKFRLEKNRISFLDENLNKIDIDLYPNGLQVVEIEFEVFPKKIPDYFGEEITGVEEYSNINIAKSNEIK